MGAVKVLYIIGYPRSGSTLLGNLLGELDGFFHAGELCYLWERNLLWGKRRCGCGVAFSQCPLWSSVMGELWNGSDPVDPASVVQWRKKAAGRPLKGRDTEVLDRYAGLMSRLYHGIAHVAGARVVIDSSKAAGDGRLLTRVPGVEPYFLHLVRDPRGVVYSRRRKYSDAGRMTPLLIAGDAGGWVGANVAAETIAKGSKNFMRMRYEDFVARPRAELQTVTRLVGEPLGTAPLVGERTARLGINHTVGGNVIRFSTGTVELEEDVRWMVGLARAERLLATAVALPLLHRYGYKRKPSLGEK